MWLGKLRKSKQKPWELKWPKEPIKIVGIYVSYDYVKANNLNTARPIENLKTCLKFWKTRDLTLAGRIQIIKTLGISRMQYLLSMVDVSKAKLREINKILYDFLWRGLDRIARHTSIGCKMKGGLNMPDIFTVNKAIRIDWIRRYCDQSIKHPWKLFLDKMLKPLGGIHLLLKCNFNIDKLQHKITGFLHTMLKTWTDIKIEIPPTKTNKIVNESIIWNNKNITVAGKSVYYPEFVNAGLMYVKQMYKDNGQKQTWNYIQNKGVPSSSILRWFGLVNAIPKVQIVNTQVNHVEDINLIFGDESLKLRDCTTRNVYHKMINSIFIRPRTEIYFIHLFEINIDCWEEFYQLPVKCTIDSKLRDFQFKILHKILVTNINLVKMKPPRVENALCTFCQKEDETLVHLFCECSYVKFFWENFFMLWGNKLKMQHRPKQWQIILGDPEVSCLVNFLILLGKRFVYISKCKQNKPDFIDFKRYVQSIQNIELAIADRKNKLAAHNKKWGNFLKLTT
ncbi:uncharacterized protein LOC144348547 [Saccoglossus kowalevskii]